MPQMDKELFIEYIYWIFLILLHHYSSYWVNMNLMRINTRRFLVHFFCAEAKFIRYEEECIRNAYQKFCTKDKWLSLNKNASFFDQKGN